MDKMKELAYSSFLLVLFLTFSLVSATTVFITPSRIEDPRLGPGSTFEVSVNVENVEDLYAYDLKLRYDPFHLDALGTSIGFLNEPIQEIKNEIDNDVGEVWIVVSSQNPAEPKSGSGTLATITFKVKKRGVSALVIYKSELSNSEAKLVEHSVRNGYFDNSGGGVTSEQLGALVFAFVLLFLILAVFLVRVEKKRRVKKRGREKRKAR